MTKEERIKELVNKYNEWDKKDDNTRDWRSCIARDEKRKISQRFIKEMHEPIENYLERKRK
ncbi:MAG: hypothetical protein II669_05750 [Elusimicrobia bacterium]|nr:hypothetical protein [Elusimicrobiota bacterium]